MFQYAKETRTYFFIFGSFKHRSDTQESFSSNQTLLIKSRNSYNIVNELRYLALCFKELSCAAEEENSPRVYLYC
jgi:hypothetical protein